MIKMLRERLYSNAMKVISFFAFLKILTSILVFFTVVYVLIFAKPPFLIFLWIVFLCSLVNVIFLACFNLFMIYIFRKSSKDFASYGIVLLTMIELLFFLYFFLEVFYVAALIFYPELFNLRIISLLLLIFYLLKFLKRERSIKRLHQMNSRFYGEKPEKNKKSKVKNKKSIKKKPQRKK
jgi:hypothetical protein